MSYCVITFLIWNVVVMLIYGFDKLMAKSSGRRISEATLLICAFLFGCYGAMFGMILFNHKTSKLKFRILVPVSNILCSAIVYALVHVM